MGSDSTTTITSEQLKVRQFLRISIIPILAIVINVDVGMAALAWFQIFVQSIFITKLKLCNYFSHCFRIVLLVMSSAKCEISVIQWNRGICDKYAPIPIQWRA